MRSERRPCFTSGIPGLDVVLGDGLRTGALYLVLGPSGAGKTVLAAQSAFSVARAGDPVVVVSLISESHAKLIDHLAGFAFFEERLVGDAVFFISGYAALREGGPESLLRLLAAVMAERQPRLLILEGFWTLRALRLSDFDIAQFLHQLNALMTTLGCTAFVVDPGKASSTSPEQALVDGVIELSFLRHDARLSRELQVHKHRAAAPLLGLNVFQLSGGGIHVFPRLEGLATRRTAVAGHTSRRSTFGIPHLDSMLGGGLVRGGTTLLLGAPGAGKTLLGLKFLEEGVARGERTMYFGFYESPPRLLAKAAGIGVDLNQAAEDGSLQLLWQPPLEFLLDEIGYRLLDAVDAHRPQRLFIDGFEGFQQSAIRKDRLPLFFTALSTELRALGIDTLLAYEAKLLTRGDPSDVFVVSALVENIIYLRYVEIRARLHRLVSIVKMRESGYDSSIREFRIGPGGLDVSESYASAEDALRSPQPGAAP